MKKHITIIHISTYINISATRFRNNTLKGLPLTRSKTYTQPHNALYDYMGLKYNWIRSRNGLE